MERCKRQRFLPYWERVFAGEMALERTGREAGAAVAVSWVALLVFGGLLARFGWFRDYSSLFVAVSFLYIPSILSRIWKRPWDVEPGLWRGSSGAAAVLLLAVGLVFPLYGAGFGVWVGWTQGRSWCGSVERVWDWPDTVRLAGETNGGPGEPVQAWVDEGGRWNVAVGASADPEGVRVIGSSGVVYRSHGATVSSANGGLGRTVVPGQRLQVEFPSGEGQLRLEGAGSVRVGGQETHTLPWESEKGLGWLSWFLLFHVLLVAIPEEYFYRGYLQHRLQRAFGRRLVLWGGDIGPAVWVTSAVFAVGHFLTIPSAFRLAVFFPSLLFGWLRDKTGTLWVPVVFHVLSNLVLEMLNRMYC